MPPTTTLFEVERYDRTLIISPVRDLSELLYEQIESDSEEILKLLDRNHVDSVIIDLKQTDYYGSTALGFFLRLWKKVRTNGGHMAMCNVSDHEREILSLMRMEQLWSLCKDRNEAIQALEDEVADLC